MIRRFVMRCGKPTAFRHRPHSMAFMAGLLAVATTALAAMGAAPAGAQSTDQAPSIGQVASTGFPANNPSELYVFASGSPTPTLSESGSLPDGLSFSDLGGGVGLISGTAGPTLGAFPIELIATNSVGTFTLPVTLQVYDLPVFTSPDTLTVPAGQARTLKVAATGTPAGSFGFDPPNSEPTGVTLTNTSPGTGRLSVSAATAVGTYTFDLQDCNGVCGLQPFTLVVAVAPAFLSPATATFTLGQPGSFDISVSAGWPTPVTISTASVLPAGLQFQDNGASASISGTPTGPPRLRRISLKATNGYRTVTQYLSLAVDGAPSFSSATRHTFVIGTAGTFVVRAPAYPLATFGFSGVLPPGVTFTDNTNGTASLTISATDSVGDAPGNYPLTLTATNGLGSASQSFTLALKS